MASPPLSNSFDGGTDTVALTQGSGGNTGGASGDFLDLVTVSADDTITFDSTHAHSGTLSCKHTLGATSSTTYMGWSGLGSLTTSLYWRGYVYATAAPSTASKFVIPRTTGNAALAQLNLTTGRILEAHDGANVLLTGGAGSVAASLNQWVRIECRFLPGNASNGEFEFWLYNTADADIASFDDHVNVTGVTLGGTDIDILRIGPASTTSAPINGSWWIDDIAVSTSGQIGPTVTWQPQQNAPETIRVVSGNRW